MIWLVLAGLSAASPAGPEVSVGLGVWPSALSLDARAHVPFSSSVDAGLTVGLGPHLFPVPMPLTLGDNRMSVVWVTGRTGLYLRHRWWLADSLLLVPSAEAVVRAQLHHVEAEELDRTKTMLGVWPELRVNARLEWRPGKALHKDWLAPLGLEARVDTTVNGPWAAYEQLVATFGVRWTFVEE